jgi:hypothetical protein
MRGLKRRRARRGCMAIGDYYCHACEQEAGPDPDPGEHMRWLAGMAAGVSRSETISKA